MEKKKKELLPKWLRVTPLKIGLFITVFSLFILVNHYWRPHNDRSDFIGALENKLLDMRFISRGKMLTKGDVGILSVDEDSIVEFGRWPFARRVYEQAFINLKKAGVKWIGFDAVFSEAERPYLDEAAEGINDALNESFKGKGFDADKFNEMMGSLLEQSEGDKSFARGLKSFENVVQGYFYNTQPQDGFRRNWPEHFAQVEKSVLDFVKFPNSRTLKNYSTIKSWAPIANIPILSAATEHQGFFNNESDNDGIVRWGTLVRAVAPVNEDGVEAGEPILLPSLSLNLAAQYLGRTVVASFAEEGIDMIELRSNDNAEPIKLPISQAGDGRFLINHYGREGSFPYISLKDAASGNLKNVPKILLFGATATAIGDIRPSPFSQMVPGVEHHAAILENILTENFLRRPPEARLWELGLLLLSGVFFSFMLRNASAVRSALYVITFCVGYYFADKYLIFGKGTWLYLGMPIGQAMSIFMSVTLYKYFTEEKEKKKVRNAFQHYLNPAVINQLMDNPDQLKLGGDKKELTVFFSDVRGFTTISEALSPEALSKLLNEYFTPMTNIILTSQGLLDKYIGDAIMAVWGAPMPVADHADRAIASSLVMLDALDVLRDKWKKEGLPMMDIGIGLNTGFMTVGNMGSDQRFDYTVMGDSVNLGARLEAINKQYGTRIICSEFTKSKIVNPSMFLLRELDDIQVKGKTKPVKIFEAVRTNQNKKEDLLELVGQFEQGLGFYRAQNWEKAQKCFTECLKVIPDDGPATEFLTRCSYLAAHSPGQDWDGVWVMKTK